MLAVRGFGDGDPVVALHGFTSTGTQFSSLKIPGRTIVAPDLPGHGDSSTVSTDADATVAAIAELLETCGSGTPLVGYSQGARLALSVAVTTQSRPACLILMSGTAGIQNSEERELRHAADIALGDEITSMGVERFIDRWINSGLTDTSSLSIPERKADREQRLANTSEGLAAAIRGYGQGALAPVWWGLATLDMPVLILTGERDQKYTAIGVELAAGIGTTAEHLVIHAAGHNLLAEQPQAVSAIVSGFLDGNC